MSGFRAGGAAAKVWVETKRTTHSNNQTSPVREAPDAGHEVNDLAWDRDSVLIIDLGRYNSISQGLAARQLCLTRFFVSLCVETLCRQSPGQRGMGARVPRIKFRRTAQLRKRFIDLSLIKQELA